MWLTIRKDWSTQCVCVLKSMCFSLFVFVLPVNWNGATTWRRILCLQSPLHATIVHKPPPTPYVYLCSMLLMASTYVWTTLFHISCFSFCQLQRFGDIIVTSIYHQKLEKQSTSLWYIFLPKLLQAGDCLWAIFSWTLIWQCTHHKTHCVFGCCLLWRLLCTLPSAHFPYMQFPYMPARRPGN